MEKQDPKPLGDFLKLIENAEPDPIVLTHEQQEYAIEQAIVSFKKHRVWRMSGMGYSQAQIDAELNTTNWREVINIDQVIATANAAFLQDQWRQKRDNEAKAQRKAEINDLVKFWTYSRMYSLMKINSERLFNRPFLHNLENDTAIKALCFFVSRNDRFMTELNLNPQKGILLRGPSGTGKTHLVRCLENNELNPIFTASTIDISAEILKVGYYNLPSGKHNILYLDDVGAEDPTVNFYGTKITWFANYIQLMYLRTKTYNHLIISTNLNFKQLEEHYGYRVASRMREMFNVVNLTGEDMRQGM
jgi:DNA replication protein DnaC